YPDFTEIGHADTTHFIFNSNNSNVKDIIQLNPHKFVFKGVVLTNPQGTPIDNFVLDSSHITVDLKIELPLYGRALNFVHIFIAYKNNEIYSSNYYWPNSVNTWKMSMILVYIN
ncbi:MAG: hypothetical protein DSY70_03070, partial [Desulfobulbus sp.]